MNVVPHTEKRPPGKTRRRRIALLAAALLAVSLAILRRDVSTPECTVLVLEGPVHADTAALVELARLGGTSVVDAALAGDRIRRHPWVHTATSTCTEDGTAVVEIQERVPVLLVVGPDGEGSHYVDAEGYRMPAVKGAAFDVPLLHGLQEAYHPVRRVQTSEVRRLAEVLPGLDEETDALVSEFALTESGLHLITSLGAVDVKLGHNRFDERLRRLRIFWRRSVANAPENRPASIDLRFDSQIIAMESDG